MKYSLIGCGRVAPNHIKAALDGGLEIVSVCDVLPEAAEKIIENVPYKDKIRVYTDYREMLAAEKPALVAIATPSGYHAEIALDCIDAGCNVIIEKPIAMSVEDADRIIEASEKKGVVVSANMQNRFNKSVQAVRGQIENGGFGRLSHGTIRVLWHRGKEYYESADWRGKWALDGGTLMNQCIHGIDLLRWMMGNDIDEVFAYTDRQIHPYIEAEDMGLALVRFSNGAYGVVEGTTNVYRDDIEETLCILGEKGKAKIGGTSVNRLDEFAFEGVDSGTCEKIKAETLETPLNVYGFGHTRLYADVISAIREHRAPYVTARDGARALELVLAIYKSASEGRPVKLPLGSCSTLDFAGRFDNK